MHFRGSELNHLFNQNDWHSVERGHKQKLLSEIDGLDENRVLNTPANDLYDYFEKEYRVDIPVLHEDQIVSDQKEVQIDVSHDPFRGIHDRSQPFYIQGTSVEITIPFSGDAEVFKISPTTYSLTSPIADVRSNVIILTFEGVKLEPESLRKDIDSTIAHIRTTLETLRNDAVNLNNDLPGLIRTKLEERRNKLLVNRDLVSSLGFPLKERSTDALTYVTPEVRRKITPQLPPVNTTPYKPEPVLSDSDYEHILSVMENMVLVMERSPSAFADMDEESMRTHFLVQLNGHYEGQATGETFNYEGKTDILIRSDNKNIFVAECKFWGGPKRLTDTVEQLLGYTSWRDTKTTIILFNRQKDFSRVLSGVPDAIKAHPNFKRELSQPSETNFRYVFSHKDDLNRELTLSVLAFDVPHNKKEEA